MQEVEDLMKGASVKSVFKKEEEETPSKFKSNIIESIKSLLNGGDVSTVLKK
jgi:hypothetical protein